MTHPTRGPQWLPVVVALGVASISLPLGASALDRDIVIVLDNSASMRRNDADFLAKQAVTDFILQLDEETRVALIIFDAEPRLAVELSYATPTNRPNILAELRHVDYWGRHTNSPAAIERAIYHLKWQGRPNADRSIVFLTDGQVETGDAERDRALRSWLQEDLAQAAADEGIRVFGVAFTEEADFRTIQTLARRTGGEYMRALAATDLRVVFEQINRMVSVPPPALDTAAEEVVDDEASIVDVPEEPPPVPTAREADEKLSLELGIAALAVVAVLALALLLYRRRAAKVERAGVLVDVRNVTGQERHALGWWTVIGRKPSDGPNIRGATNVVVPKQTISRKHGVIQHRNAQYWLSDAGTRNGTFVNGVRIEGERALSHGDRIRFETYEFEFRYLDLEGDPDQTKISDGLEDADATMFTDSPNLTGDTEAGLPDAVAGETSSVEDPDAVHVETDDAAWQNAEDASGPGSAPSS